MPQASRRAAPDGAGNGAYQIDICNQGTTKLLREKIKQTPEGIFIETA
jgi:hypothetical protein